MISQNNIILLTTKKARPIEIRVEVYEFIRGFLKNVVYASQENLVGAIAQDDDAFGFIKKSGVILKASGVEDYGRAGEKIKYLL